jgi:hypothetical protein
MLKYTYIVTEKLPTILLRQPKSNKSNNNLRVLVRSNGMNKVNTELVMQE